VGIGLVPINGGLLVIQRAIKPCIGEWALPGGYKEIGETWEQGIAREIFEEAGLRVDPLGITLAPSGVKTANNGGVLVFGLCKPLFMARPLQFKFDHETLDAKIVTESVPLCFPHHQTMLDWFFSRDTQTENQGQ
jgi:ADP-ribose pyrophosphatase YjhB (NUDIX family)